MIDSHTHTFYSKHATGTIDELVQAAISKGIDVLTITDHAPFHMDRQNRLLESELAQYCADIERAKHDYKGVIKVLRGLEFDYMPDTYNFTKEIVSRYDLDFVIGSIHYVPMANGDHVNVWDLPRLANTKVLDSYFKVIAELLECGLFDAVGHADVLLRGVSDSVVNEYFEPVLPFFTQHNIAFELNGSGLRKTTLDHLSSQEVHGKWSYPSLSLIQKLIGYGTNFTIGSDAHSTFDVGAGIIEVVESLIPLGLTKVSYFENRHRIDVLAKLLTSEITKKTT